jgi:flagellar hook-associated protein 2
MSTESIGTGSTGSISFSGLASGLNTSAIISALLAAERQPILRLTNQQERLSGQQSELQTLQSTLQQLSFAASEFVLPSLFEGVQSVTSSEPARISAAISSGAGVGGYQVEVTQLANSAQRTFAFASPAAEDTITIEGREYKLKAGGTAKELASKINADGKGGVFAAVQGEATIVLSSRQTGAGGAFVAVADPGGALTEKAGTAKEGRNAEYKIDGVAGTSTSNVLTEAIAGVSLTLSSLTSAGPVTIAVHAPAASVKAIEAQLESFVKAYNSTVEAIAAQLKTKPLGNPQKGSEFATGSLFGDASLSNLLNRMRQGMYESIPGLEAGMASPLDIGVTTGAGAGGKSTQGALAGMLKLDPEKLAAAIQSNPEGAKTMMQKWAQSFSKTIDAVAAPGGSLQTRISGDAGQIREMKLRIQTMNEMLAVRQRALQETYAKLEGVISRNSSQTAWLANQASLLANSKE